MDLKKFKLNLENNLGKRLDKVSKDFINYKIELEKAKNQLRDISRYIEGKNSCKRHSVPMTPRGDFDKGAHPFALKKPAAEESKKKLDSAHTVPLKTHVKSVSNTPKATPVPLNNHIEIPVAPVVVPPKVQRPRQRRVIIPKISLESINSQLQDFEAHYSQDILNCVVAFNISLGAKSAFDIIKGMHKDNF